MTRNSVPIGSFGQSAARGVWSRAVMVMAAFAVVSGQGSSPGSRCEAAGIAGFLTAKDRSGAHFISENGLPISSGSASSSGSMPAYVAFPLYGGEHLPGGVSTVMAGSQAGGTPVGPLDLTPVVQASLNADLNTGRMAIVQTPTQSYAVEYLPRYGLSQVHASSTASTAGSGQAATSSSTSSSSSNPLSSLASSLTIAGIPASELSKWTSTQIANLEKDLHLGGSSAKATVKKPSTNVEAQYLTPPLGESSGSPLPTPAPEPSTWLVFGLLLGIGGWRHRAGKTV
jgi:hypothetical protein